MSIRITATQAISGYPFNPPSASPFTNDRANNMNKIIVGITVSIDPADQTPYRSKNIERKPERNMGKVWFSVDRISTLGHI